MSIALDLARASYRGISLYSPDRTPCAIDLSDNTNLWGVPPGAARAVREAFASSITRYPPLYATALKEALAGYLGVPGDMIVTGCGSDDVLDSAIRAFAEPGDMIAFPDPSFAMIPIFARMNGLETAPIPLEDGRDIDADAMLATQARIIYLCSPNNPTSTALDISAIERIVERAPGLVILDEAYAEFATRNGLSLLERSERLLITRTMSKAFGLAGLRIGYAAGAPALVAEVEKSRGPYKVNALAERAAMTALGEDLPWVRDRVAELQANRARLAAELTALGLEPMESSANFCFVPTSRADELARGLRTGGIAVRPFTDLPSSIARFHDTSGAALRITVGPWEMMEPLLDVLATLTGIRR